MGISCVQSFFSWVLLGVEIFLESISWEQIFSRRHFVGPKCFVVGISWVPLFFLVANFVIQRLPVAEWMRESTKYIFFSIRISSLITVIDSYLKNTCPIVLLTNQIT